jgi:GT2 family glycosyltransferase
MRLDVSLVLFGGDLSLARHGLDSLKGQAVHSVWLLASGCDEVIAHQVDEFRDSVPFDVNLLVRADNLGFALGHNFLAEAAFTDGAEALFVMNPDLVISPGGLQELLSHATRHHWTRSVHGPQLRLVKREELGESAGSRVDSNGVRWSASRRHFDIGQGQPFAVLPDSTSVDGVSGAALLIGRQSYKWLLGDLGYLFDPLFLAYRADAELGSRVLAIGGRCWIHPSSCFTHGRGSLNAKRETELQRYLGIRNRFLIAFRIGWIGNGRYWAGPFRDCLVVASGMLGDSSGRRALVDAWSVRRTMKYKRRLLYSRSSHVGRLSSGAD